MKINEFADATEAVINGYGNQLALLLCFIESQTEAKQKKFWNYFDANTVNCANCQNKVLADYTYKSQITGDCCSVICSIEYAESNPIK